MSFNAFASVSRLAFVVRVAAVATLLAQGVIVVAQESGIHVSSCTTTSGGDGTATRPFRTLKQAVDAAESTPGTQTIRFDRGFYAEPISIRTPVRLRPRDEDGRSSVSMVRWTRVFAC